MVVFEDLEEVEEWLEPLDYVAFWEAVAPYSLFSMEDRDHCDRLIAGAKVKPATILKGLKGMAVDELTRRFELTFRKHQTPELQAIKSLH